MENENTKIISVMEESQKELYQKMLSIINVATEEKKIYSHEIDFIKRMLRHVFVHYFFKALNKNCELSEDAKNKKSIKRFNDVKIINLVQLGKLKKLSIGIKNEGELKYASMAQELILYISDINEKIKKLSTLQVKKTRNKEGEMVEILKEKQTCPCCFRSMEVDLKGNIVNHGYRRIEGVQTASCFGQGYPSFEVSNVGTVSYIQYIEGKIISLKEDLEKIKKEEILTIEGKNRKMKVFKIDSFFEYYQKQEMTKIEQEIIYQENNLSFLKNKMN